MKKKFLFFNAFFLGISYVLFSQNVGIGNTSFTPDASAMLEVRTTNKGVLLPRVNLTSANDATTISNPATALLVFNTGSGGLTPAGFYYNAGTPSSPNWVRLQAEKGWLLTGNSGTSPASNFLGTTDNQPLVIKTNNTERMRITSDGKIGIGTSSPLNPLHVISSVSGGIVLQVENTATTGTSIAIRGKTNSNDGYAIVGWNASTTAPTNTFEASAIYGQSDAPGSVAIWGVANNNSTTSSVGILGETRGANSFGVVGLGNGLYSGTMPSEGAGGYFRGNKYGVYTYSNGGSGTYALYAYNSGSNGNGIRADVDNGTTAWAIWGRNTASGGYAGYFTGNVNITGSISKGGGSFLIDHPLDPLNKTLRHNFVESPENLCIYRGKVKLDEEGKATVSMPDYFKALTKEEEATVILTPIGRTPFLTSYEWNSDYSAFTIYGQPSGEISYQVLADRDDPVIQMLRRPVVEEKGNGNFEKGYLLYPKAYGYPESMSVETWHEQLKE